MCSPDSEPLPLLPHHTGWLSEPPERAFQTKAMREKEQDREEGGKRGGPKEVREIEIHEWKLAFKKTLQRILMCSLGGDLLNKWIRRLLISMFG